ncbi:Uncharacterised protein [Metamycoplasma alkalescens]|nr:Uncharacterised protein [Metamycoplasma alkalescens]
MKIDEDDADDDLDLEIDSLITTEFVEKVDSAYINSLTQIISETNDIEVIQATKEELNKMILKFPVSEQKYARQCLEPTLNNNQKLPSNFDLNLCVFELKEKEENLELEEFAKNLNVNIKELKNIIHSNEDIYANNNLQNLCRNSYNDQVREYISEIKKFPLEKVKRINIENFIKEFILHKRKNTS